MQLNDITTYFDYRVFITNWLHSQPRKGHGLKSRLAESLGCRQSYLSKVLQGESDLSPEQSIRTAKFLGLNRHESRYFRLLVDHARASTYELKEEIKKELGELHIEMQRTGKRLAIDHSIDQANLEKYYASWHTAAIHLTLGIMSLDSPERIARYTRLPLDRVNQIIQDLIELQLVGRVGGGYKVLKDSVHLDKDSAFANQQLMNWRIKALEEIPNRKADSVHFSGAVSLSKKDAEVVRDILNRSLRDAVDVVKKSGAEEVFVLNLDWFPIR